MYRVTISRSYGNTVMEKDFAVENNLPVASQAVATQDNPAQGIKMEVGIEDCLP